MLKRTPLFAAHQQLGGRLVEFGGWEMPVQYTSIVEEHQAVRQAAGLFDISHMGEVFVRGAAAEAFLNATLTNDVRKLTPGTGQYTLMCNERGGVVDDLYCYRLAPAEFLLIINAARIPDDVAWLEQRLAAFPQKDAVTLLNASDEMAAVALQGPRARGLIDPCFAGGQPSTLKKNQIGSFRFNGTSVWVGCTGYTGEDGFEIIAPAAQITAIWNALLAAGAKPCGLGARDTLRTEVCYPLYGHELNEDTTPIEAGLGFFVALDKGEFTGRSVLAGQKANGVTKRCVAFKMTGKSAPPRPHYAIFSAGPDAAKVGEVVSGTQSPSLGIGIGLGYVPPALARPETPLQIEIRGQCFPAMVVPKPIYRKAV
ncbi:MAG TPA: glycine cleavage system aminomethyltransferase GcvT [Verrucomicrobiae bacterium]|nr:glycine cleavage system aminomethyltransferase GcvT [Verrucomicrobiae bacterium]